MLSVPEELALEIETLLPATSASENKTDEVAPLTRRIEEKRKCVSAILRSVDEEAAHRAKDELGTLHREIKDLEFQVAEAKAKDSAGAFNPAETARQIDERLWDFRRVIEEGTPDERKRLIRKFVGEIPVDAAK
jgi:hypothetical protein